MEVKKQRQYHRVDDLLPFLYRRVTAEDYELLTKKYISGTLCEVGVSSLPPQLEQLYWELEEETSDREHLLSILKYLYTLDMKLNHIINYLSGKQEDNLLFRKPEKINISGSGARFMTDERFEKDELLEIRILLPGWPFTLVPALAEVVHVDPDPDGKRWEIAVRFTAISEGCRDQLTRYIMRMERGLLRAQAERKLSAS